MLSSGRRWPGRRRQSWTRSPSGPGPITELRCRPIVSPPDPWEAANESYYERGLTDGLPIVPPTRERVAAMVAASGRDAGEVLGTLPPSWAPAVVEKVAVNAVMAGCRPEYMPVVVAAIEAMARPEFNLCAVQATGSPVSPAIVVNGPMAGRLGISGGYNCLGQGHRANATIGRAVRLALMNIAGGRPGETDRASQGWPGKYTLCFAENEAESPWDPLHVDLGYPRDASTVTVFGARGTTSVSDPNAGSAEAALLSLALHLVPSLGRSSPPVVVLTPEIAALIARDGVDKDGVRRFLWQQARRPYTAFSREVQDAAFKARRQGGLDPYGPALVAERPEDIIVLVAGGAGYHSTLIPTAMATAVTQQMR